MKIFNGLNNYEHYDLSNPVFESYSKYIAIIILSTLLLLSTGCTKKEVQKPQTPSSSVTRADTKALEQADADKEDIEEEAENTIPDSDIYIAKLTFIPGLLEISEPVIITDNPGYDNQPYFLPDNNTILFASRRGDETSSQQTDIYAYFINSKKISRMTDTPESEYSPIMTPSGETISVVRVELDSTQRLWEFPIQGKLSTVKDFEVVFPEIERVGYHTWADNDNAFLFLVDNNLEGENHTLELASRQSSITQKIAPKIGRSFSLHPENNALMFIDKSNDISWKIRRYDLEKKLAAIALPALKDSEDMLWLDAEHVLMAKGRNIYRNTIDNKYGDNWQLVSNNATKNLPGNITRLAISDDKRWLALVVTK